MGGLNATKKKKPIRGTPQARGDAQNPISCSRHQAPGTRHQASRPPGDADCPGAGAPSRDQGPTAPPRGPDSTGANAGQTRPCQGPGLSPASCTAPGPTGGGGHSGLQAAGRTAPPRAAESETSCGQAPRPSTSSVSPQRPALRPSCVRPGLRAAGPTALSWGWAQFRGSAPQAPGGQDSRTEARPCGDTGGRLGTRAVCTPGALPRTARGKAEPFSQIHLTLILI